MKMSFTLERIVTSAVLTARKCRHEFITAEHLLFCAMGFKMVTDIFKDAGVNSLLIKKSVKTYLETKIPVIPQQFNIPPRESVFFQAIMSKAVFCCIENRRAVLDVGDVLLSMFDEAQSYCSFYMRNAGLDRAKLVEAATKNNAFLSDEATVALEFQNAPFARRPQSQSREEVILNQFCTDMTKVAKEGGYDAVIGRTNEIERTIQVLSRRTKNNALHVGDAGVGKTAITQGLATLIASGKVCDELKGSEVWSMDLGAVLAGSRFRGDFEERLYGIINALKKKKKAILFIDEIHTIIGAGSSGGGGTDAANLLKPILTSGNIRVIGSTTFEEYAKSFEKDRALNRRFQKIAIKEPTRDEAIKIVLGVIDKYEKFHNVRYSKDAIREAVDLSIQYICDKRLPDKAIDVIDEAAAFVKIHSSNKWSSATLAKDVYTRNKEEVRAENTFAQHSTSADSQTLESPSASPSNTAQVLTAALFKKVPNSTKAAKVQKLDTKKARSIPVVSTAIVRKVVSKIAGVDIEAIGVNEKKSLMDMEKALKSQLFGQDKAVSLVVSAVKKARAGLKNPDKPDAAFLFVGPTGVGKTELSRLVAQRLHIPLLRFDMSEYQEPHTVSRLIGSPAGYIGHEEGGLLTDAVRKNPRALVLFDEIEKADNDIYNVLLQVMDYGFLTDSQGTLVDFRNTLIVMTSNTGAREIERAKVGFSATDFDDMSDALGVSDTTQEDATYMEACKKEFSAEFRNRLTAIVPFYQLTKRVVLSIVEKECEKLKKRFLSQKVHIAFTPACIQTLAQKGYSRVYGARNIERTVNDEVATPLVDKVLFGNLSAGGYIVADSVTDSIVFNDGSLSSPYSGLDTKFVPDNILATPLEGAQLGEEVLGNISAQNLDIENNIEDPSASSL